MLKLLGRRERWLAVAAIRFLRTCLALKDEFYNRYVVSHRDRPLTCSWHSMATARQLRSQPWPSLHHAGSYLGAMSCRACCRGSLRML